MRGRLPVLVLAVLCLGFATACDDDESIDLGGIDCGLVRDDLIGDWTADYPSGTSRTLTNCTGDDPSIEGSSIDVSGTPVIYTNADVLGNNSSPSFKVVADRLDGDDVSQDAEFVMNIGADSCQAFVLLWESDDTAYVQCIGTFTPSNGTLLGACDSAEVDTDGNDDPDTSCSLSAPIDVAIGVN